MKSSSSSSTKMSSLSRSSGTSFARTKAKSRKWLVMHHFRRDLFVALKADPKQKY